MVCKGTIRGNAIQFDQPLPFREGQAVTVSVEPAEEELPLGSPARLLRAMHEEPHVAPDIVDEFERLIEEGKSPVRYEGVFDSEMES
jgi:hypothetical protein